MAKFDKEELEFQKIYLREFFLPNKKAVKVLDAFSGDGIIWTSIKNRNGDREFEVDRVDKAEGFTGQYTVQNNLEYMKANSIHQYDVIDLDAPTHPLKQLYYLCNQKYSGVVFCTLKEGRGNKFPKKMLLEMGYPSRMVDKAPKLFQLNIFDKICLYLGKNNINNIYSIENKNYKLFTYSK